MFTGPALLVSVFNRACGGSRCVHSSEARYLCSSLPLCALCASSGTRVASGDFENRKDFTVHRVAQAGKVMLHASLCCQDSACLCLHRAPTGSRHKVVVCSLVGLFFFLGRFPSVFALCQTYIRLARKAAA